jgi:putative molybdopterin biosynthesis protein
VSGRRHLTVGECAQLLSVSAKTVRGLIDRGDLPAYRVGRVLRIDPADLEALRYRPREAGAPDRSPRPRPVRGEFARLARGLAPGEPGR